jgi:phage shock protein C
VNDRLYRSRDERIFAGVAGGVAERFGIDPSLVRIGWVILMFLSGGLFFLLYVVMAFVVPEAPAGLDRWAAWSGAPGPGAVPGWGPAGSGAGPVGAGVEPGGAGGKPSGAGGAAGGASPASADEPGGAGPGPEPGAAGATFAGPEQGAPPPQGGPPSGAWTPGIPPGPPPWSMPRRPRHRERSGIGTAIAGLVLVVIGGYFLLQTLLPELELGAFWPAVIVLIGVALVVGSLRPGSGDGAAD